jgi:hypothetical protein
MPQLRHRRDAAVPPLVRVSVAARKRDKGEEARMRLIRGTDQPAARDGTAVTQPNTDTPTSADDERLSDAQREAIAGLLKELGIGDAIARQLFLAALDYQVSTFSRRMGTLDGHADVALLERACVEAAGQLHDTAPDDTANACVQQLCVSFVREIARSYDACFETPPTADRQGPFSRVLANLSDAAGLPALPCSAELIRRSVNAGGEQPA